MGLARSSAESRLATLLLAWRMLIRWRDEGFHDDFALVCVDEADPSIQVLNLPQLTRL